MSETNYSWKGARYGSASKVSRQDHLTRWILIAIFLAIACHVVVLIAMKKMPLFFDTSDSGEIVTQSVVVRNVMEREYIDQSEQNEMSETAERSEIAKNFLEELEMLENAPEDIEIDFSATVKEPEMFVPMEATPLAGEVDASANELTEGLKFEDSIEDLGSTDDFLQAAAGQITIDPGKQAADEFDPDKFNTELAKGEGGESREGVMEGFTALAEMTRLSQSDLEQAKGMIGSDLLYDFGKATLRDSAKNSLLKVVLIIDKNPNMKCWIEGHTDLIGTDEANVQLSLARAEAVKYWLVNSMRIPEDRLFVRGLGKSQPIVLTGDQDAQAINRRVEIKMRKNPPPLDVAKSRGNPTKKARIIKPMRNPNLAEVEKPLALSDSRPDRLPPKAVVVEDNEQGEADQPVKVIPAKAILVEEETPRNPVLPAEPVEPVPPRAVPVE